MESHELMRLLVPDAHVKAVAEFTGLTSSLLYGERRRSGKDHAATGIRNTIDRLDLFCEFNLDRNPDVVRMVGERYLRMYEHHIAPIEGPVTVYDLLAQLGSVTRECGEASAALAGRQSVKKCTVEVAQARRALEKALALVIAMEEEE